MSKKVAIYTLGCKMNQVDSEAIRESFVRAGYETVDYKTGEADVYVVNSCTVTGRTDHQVRQMVRRALKIKEGRPSVRVVIAGCYPQTRADEVLEYLPEVDLVAGNLDKERIPQMLQQDGEGAANEVRDIFSEREFRPAPIETFSNYSRAFLRIQEGCNNRCSYCVVPYARGKSRSAPPGDVLAQTRSLAENGYREVVLAGIHIGRYGLDLEPKTTLARLIRDMAQIASIKRIRLSSIDPKEFSDELYDTMDGIREKMCPHFHVSLQSGDDEILRKMRRGYTAAEFREVNRRLMELFPDAAVGADVIVGFPGETDEAFESSLELVSECQLAYMHIFRYSMRPGTPAADMPDQVQEKIKQQRSRRLHEVKQELTRSFRNKFKGRVMEVILENRRLGNSGRLTGITRNYIRVFADGPDELMGRLVTAKVTGIVKGGVEVADLEPLE